jgi:hypothetical protein
VRARSPTSLALVLAPALALLVGGVTLARPRPAAAEPGPGASAAPDVPTLAEDAVTPRARLSGRDIYQCVLNNRFDAFVQESRLVSGDRGEGTQESRLRMTWSSFRDEHDDAVDGVLSKTLVKYTEPFDLRFSGYLIVHNAGRPNDQFVYLASSRRIRRVNLRRESVFGTDFSFEDVVPREIEDSSYERLPDRIVDGVPAYVVEVTPLEHAESQYSRFVIEVEKERCIPLRTRYWDERGVEVKELTVPVEAIEQVGDVWWAMRSTMRNLQLDTFTKLEVEKLVPNPKLRRKTFDLRRLESH